MDDGFGFLMVFFALVVILGFAGIAYQQYSNTELGKACVASGKTWAKSSAMSGSYECR